ncbi:MAG: LptF/LptG family permease [Alphaproteobacteria bacterium]|nr:LptF/LptG family permease [Alphaproteobacteria bacterium]
MATLLTSVVLAAIILLTQSLKFLELIIESGASSTAFWLLTLMALPRFFEVILPIATMIGCLFVYNRLASDSEVVVMRAAGFSPILLAKPALRVAILVSALMLFITMWLAPVTLSNMQHMRQVIKAQYSALLLREGVFNQLGDDLTVYVHNKNKEGALEGIIVHDSRDNLPEPVTILAKKGMIVLSDEGQQVLVYDGSRQDVSGETGTLNRLDFDRYSIDLPEGKDVRLRWKEPDERTFLELLNPDENLKRDRDNKDAFIVEAHRRIVTPFLSITFTVVVLATLLLGPVNRRGQAWRVTLAAASVVVLQGLFLGSVNQSSQSVFGLIGMYLITFAPLIGGVLLLSPYSEKVRQKWLYRRRSHSDQKTEVSYD